MAQRSPGAWPRGRPARNAAEPSTWRKAAWVCAVVDDVVVPFTVTLHSVVVAVAVQKVPVPVASTCHQRTVAAS